MSDFAEYLRQGEPGRNEKVAAWQVAIGLQGVDGLKPSAYLVDTAKRHIDGDITIDQVKGLIDTYYKSRQGRLSTDEERSEEADKVSARITEILQEDTFSFTPVEYQRIHRKLFTGIFKFAAHSWYFRNALVRANYANRDKGISPDVSYLESFLRNLILGENNDLKNRYLHISYQSDRINLPKGQFDPLEVTLEERAVLNCLSQNNRIVQKEIALAIGKSERTVKRIMASLSERGIIIRKNGKRNGYWEVL